MVLKTRGNNDAKMNGTPMALTSAHEPPKHGQKHRIFDVLAMNTLMSTFVYKPKACANLRTKH